MACALALPHEVPQEHSLFQGVKANGQQPAAPVHVDPSVPSEHSIPTHVSAGGAGADVPPPTTQWPVASNVVTV